ncbi:MAG TPA: hypothetical protein VF681_03480 [Abditibacteriaceae bacterium]|jgi:hypothetical protein
MMNFEEIFAQLESRQPLAPLFPRAVWQPALSPTILQLPIDDATRAGLLLWNDDMEASHILSQSIESATGSLWHAVMHRREGDASNSNYWWRKTGAHPAFELLYPRAVELLREETAPDAQQLLKALESARTWQPELFVRACQSENDWCERLQHLEFATFLSWCRAQ